MNSSVIYRQKYNWPNRTFIGFIKRKIRDLVSWSLDIIEYDSDKHINIFGRLSSIGKGFNRYWDADPRDLAVQLDETNKKLDKLETLIQNKNKEITENNDILKLFNYKEIHGINRQKVNEMFHSKMAQLCVKHGRKATDLLELPDKMTKNNIDLDLFEVIKRTDEILKYCRIKNISIEESQKELFG